MNYKIKIAAVAAVGALGLGVGLTACGSDPAPTWQSYAQSVRQVVQEAENNQVETPAEAHEFADSLRDIKASPSESLDRSTDELADHLDQAATATTAGDDQAAQTAAIAAVGDVTDIYNEVSTAPQEVRDAWGVNDVDGDLLNNYNDQQNYPG